MALVPIENRILVEAKAPDTVSSGGIIIPDTAKDKPQEGEVVAVGEGRRTHSGNLVPMQVKVGDKIIFGNHIITEVEQDNKTLILMLEDNVLGITSEWFKS